jgi:hypothetical protein
MMHAIIRSHVGIMPSVIFYDLNDAGLIRVIPIR